MTNPFDSARTAGLDTLVSIALQDASGVAVVPVSLDWRLLDEADVEVIAWNSLAFDSASPPLAAEIPVPAASNELPATEVFGLRTVELLVTHATGTLTLTSTYALQAQRKLIPMVNSYGTAGQVLIACRYLSETDVQHLTGASEDDRTRALLGSYRAIELLPLMVVSDKGVELGWLRDMDAATRALKIEPQMRQALLQAQIVDASHILGLPGDPVMQARLNGMISMTVGESSQFFGTTRPPELQVSRTASRLLGRYMRRNVRIGRA
jgi:hypothetical protein